MNASGSVHDFTPSPISFSSSLSHTVASSIDTPPSLLFQNGDVPRSVSLATAPNIVAPQSEAHPQPSFENSLPQLEKVGEIA